MKQFKFKSIEFISTIIVTLPLSILLSFFTIQILFSGQFGNIMLWVLAVVVAWVFGIIHFALCIFMYRFTMIRPWNELGEDSPITTVPLSTMFSFPLLLPFFLFIVTGLNYGIGILVVSTIVKDPKIQYILILCILFASIVCSILYFCYLTIGTFLYKNPWRSTYFGRGIHWDNFKRKKH